MNFDKIYTSISSILAVNAPHAVKITYGTVDFIKIFQRKFIIVDGTQKSLAK